ncbi:hypothetical protein FALBO_10292 [Fusarium albosuccineum]|uniref:Uncharacterized protein n=1 Tax=Fusarium albosuccineum TaxID=1237068 RepID=A0A8H4P574_9HYPO|nr:hypothetical protein FALBO_10292 [Fusarium albosuccineum]
MIMRPVMRSDDDDDGDDDDDDDDDDEDLKKKMTMMMAVLFSLGSQRRFASLLAFALASASSHAQHSSSSMV